MTGDERTNTAPNQHILDELEYYRRAEGRAFYAIQIDAPWGAGKSHFISSYVQREIPGKPNEDTPLGVTVTLFGAKSVDDLENQIVAQIFTKSDRAIGTLFSGVIAGAAKHFQGDKLVESLTEASKDSLVRQRLKRVRAGGMIVFDDIERSGMPLTEALGYINRFVELEGYKVVLVSNEQAFDREDASQEAKANGAVLRAFKEKLIGRTLKLVADPEATFDSFASAMKNDAARQLVCDERAAILRVFAAGGRDNLRSLRMGLEAFDRIAAILSPRVLGKREAFLDIALSCVYVAIELAAAVDGQVVCNPSAGHTRRLVASLGRGAQHEPTPAEEALADILTRYGELVSFYNPAVPFGLLCDFIAGARLDADQINAAAESSLLVADPDDLPPWRSLVEIWELDAVGIEKHTNRALEQLDRLEVRDPGELLHLAGVMLWRASFGDLQLSKGLTPLESVRDYLGRLHDAGFALEPREMTGPMLAAHGLVPIAPDQSKFELLEIYRLINGSVDQAKKTRYPEMREQLENFLSSKNRVFQDLYSGSNDLAAYVRLPLFEDADPMKLVDIILRNGRFDYAILDWLTERYRLSQAALLVPESRWLKGVAEELRRRVAEAPPPLDKFWAKLVADRVDPLLAQSEAALAAADDGQKALANLGTLNT